MLKKLPHRILALSTMLLLVAGFAHAQEAGNTEVHRSEKTTYTYGGESESQGVAKLKNVSKVDSAAFNTSKLPSLEAQKAQKQASEDDSVLSFNFLYYIIRKYKMQDIID
jgi:hypothetical protein